jgi:cold-inducible RNA-binding protein
LVIFSGEKMESKLYVGNLPYTISETELQEMFAQAGEVKSVVIIKDRESGRSKGFGFVEMATAEEAQKAITMYNGKAAGGRALTVNMARPQEERRPGGGGGGDRRGGYSNDRGRGQGGGRRQSW